MAQDTGRSEERALGEAVGGGGASPERQATPGAQTVQAAPEAVRRSMPMALSILLGILLATLAAWFFQALAEFILLLYLSFVAASVLDAPVGWLVRHSLRRGLAAVLVMLAGLLFFGGIFALLASGLYNQYLALSAQLQKVPARIDAAMGHLFRGFPGVADSFQGFNFADKLRHSFPSLATVWHNTMAGVAVLSSLVVAFFMVMYMLIDGPGHLKAARCLLPKASRLEATRLFNGVARSHRGWALASLINVTSATTLIATGLYLVGLPGAIIFGFIAGLGELIPNVGPFFGALPALLFAMLLDFNKFPYVLGMFIVMQTIQSYTISPQVLRFSVKLPVLVTIISVLVMGSLFGLLGIIAAIPLVTDMVVVGNYFAARSEKDPTDYDCVNSPAALPREAPGSGVRERAAVESAGSAPPPLFRRFFARRRTPGDSLRRGADQGQP